MNMRKLSSILVLGLTLMTAEHAPAKEQTVSFLVDGQKVVGTLDLPEGVKNPPVVLMLHGFTGTRNELSSDAVPQGLFGRAASILSQKGIASLRIDFRGSGESEGKFEDVTIETEITDALAAMDYLAQQPDIDKNRISVMGMSFGGIVATAVSGRSTIPPKSVVLWNPGINPPSAFTAIFGENGMNEGLASGDKVYNAARLSDNKIIPLKGRFFESLFAIVPSAELAKYKGPVFLAVGTKDNIVYPQPALAKTLLSYHQGGHELLVLPVDHGFDADNRHEAVDEVIEKTLQFLIKNNKETK